jgi:O-antigen/teichoic acid export membrane protein
VTGAIAAARLRLVPGDAMQRSAIALTANTGITAVLGFLYWVVAARYYSPAVVGASAALISAMVLMANIADLNLYNTLTRFLPTAGRHTRRYTLRAYAAVAATSVVVALVALPLLRGFDLIRELLGWGPAGVLLVVAALLVWTVFALQDGVAIGARATAWVPVENGVFGATKLVLLVALAGVIPQYGVFWSWFLAMVPVLLLMNLLLFGRLLPRHARESAGGEETITPRDVAGFLTLDNVALLGATAVTYLLPVIVVVRAGAEANGYFYVAWGVVAVLDVALVNVASALTVEGARQRERLGELVAGLLRRTALVAVPLIAIVFAGAPLILALYGETYVEHSTELLRVVVLAVAPRIVVVVWMSLNRVRQRLGRILAVQAVLTVAVLALAWTFLPAYGILAVGIAHVGVQSVVALALLPDLRRAIRARPPASSN